MNKSDWIAYLIGVLYILFFVVLLVGVGRIYNAGKQEGFKAGIAFDPCLPVKPKIDTLYIYLGPGRFRI